MISKTEKFGSTFYQHKAQKDNIGPSSLKILDGEDLTMGNRRRLNQMQMKHWLDQQVQEKQMQQNIENKVDQMHATQTLTVNKQWDSVDKEYEKRRLDMRNCTREFQEQQQKEKANRDAAESQWLDELGKQHINYCTNHDFFTENTQTCTSHVAPYRVLKYHWKGMDAGQTKVIRLEQLRQAEDKRLREEMEREEERMWAAQEEANRRNLLRVQREHDRQKAARVNDQVVEYNKLKAKEVERRDKILYDNVHAYK